MRQTLAVNRVADARGGFVFAHAARGCDSVGAGIEGVDGDDRVLRSMNEEHRRQIFRRPPADSLRQMLRADEGARIGQNGGWRAFAAQPHMQRHHRALAEAHQRKVGIRQPARLQFGIKEGVDHGRGGAGAAPQLVGIALRKGEPLPAKGILAAGLMSVRRCESRIWQKIRPFVTKPDQVGAVRAIAVQNHHELACGARAGLDAGTVDGRWRHLKSPCDYSGDDRALLDDGPCRRGDVKLRKISRSRQSPVDYLRHPPYVNGYDV